MLKQSPLARQRCPVDDITNHDDRAAFVCAITALGVVAGDFTAVGDKSDGWILLPRRAFVQNWAWDALEANAGEEAMGGVFSTARADPAREADRSQRGEGESETRPL